MVPEVKRSALILTPRKYLNHGKLGRGSAQKSGMVKRLNYPFLFWVRRGSHTASGQCDLSCPCWIIPWAAQHLCALLCPNAVPAGGLCAVPVLATLRRYSEAGAWLSLRRLPAKPCLSTVQVFQAPLHFSSPII